MNVLGIIPARYASTRLEGKPLVDLCGKTMIQRVYEQAQKALNHVLVATDDERIEKAVKDFGGNVILTSHNHNTGTNRCLEAYNKYLELTNLSFDVILNIQGDEPLLAPEQITSLVGCFDSINVEMATLVIPTVKNEDLDVGVFVVFDNSNNAMYFSRSIIPNVRDENKENWNNNHTFHKHVGMYGFTPKSLEKFANLNETTLEKSEKLEQLRWLENGGQIKIAVTKHRSVPIDTIEDVEKVKNIIQSNM